MTLNPGFALYYRDYPMVMLWNRNKDLLFFPREASEEDGEQHDLTSKAYILMKRLGQDYDKIMQMDAEERDTIFKWEMQLIKEEQKQAKK